MKEVILSSLLLIQQTNLVIKRLNNTCSSGEVLQNLHRLEIIEATADRLYEPSYSHSNQKELHLILITFIPGVQSAKLSEIRTLFHAVPCVSFDTVRTKDIIKTARSHAAAKSNMRNGCFKCNNSHALRECQKKKEESKNPEQVRS